MTCASGLSCLCGVCTRACVETAACAGLAPEVVCLTTEQTEEACPGDQESAICDVLCATSLDCLSLGDGFVCDAGHCREPGDGAGCERADATASGVVVLGDALMQLSDFSTLVAELARDAGAVSSDASIRSYASALDSFLAERNYSIHNQYVRAKADGFVTLAIMNGGETDVLQETCGTAPAPDCPALQAALAGAEILFSEMAADGVRDVVYVYYADPVDRPTVLAGLDVLRPLIETACADATLDCRFLDLRPIFERPYDEYAGNDGLVWSDLGARVTAGAVWDLLQSECIDWTP
jgi:hypothetical protein